MNDMTQGYILKAVEQAKRDSLRKRKPYLADKMARIVEMEERGEVSPQIRLEKSYLCNFQCTHCSAEYYMDRHLENVIKIVDDRQKMTYDEIRNLSRQADELGLARFVITGGEPLVMRDFDQVVEAIDPEKHYIMSDTNGWFLDAERAKHIKSVGVEKIQMSLDSYIEADHDKFRNKPGSYKRVMRAIDAALDADLLLILATVLVKGRARTQEFRDLCKFITDRGIGLYVSYAKPTGSCTNHPEFVIDKADADAVRELEKEYNVFTHMTPGYGSFKGCITVKGTITVTSTMEVNPCPYIDMSIGNLRETPLKTILERGMNNPWLGDHRPDCLIGEDQHFIKLHMEKTAGAKTLPIPWGHGFTDQDKLPERERYVCIQPEIDYEAIHKRLSRHLGTIPLEEFRASADAIRATHPGVGVPFFLRPMVWSELGAALDLTFLPALKASFEEAYPGQRFTNYCRLTGKLSTGGSVQRNIVGWYFPGGEGETAGPMETLAAFIGSPGLLQREDGYPPLLWLGTLSDARFGYCLEAYGADLTFNRRPHLGKTSEYWATGRMVLQP